jgi:hypothetical protein
MSQTRAGCLGGALVPASQGHPVHETLGLRMPASTQTETG